jgi:hypothetical protein
LNGMDFLNVRDGHRESGSLFKQAITVLRFQNYSGGSVNGVQKTRNNLDFPVMATIYHITPKDALNSGGYYLAGDVETDTESDIVGVSNVSSSLQQADQMKYNGQLYQVEGMPQRILKAGGRIYTKTLWRRI